MQGKILIVDDEISIRDSLKIILDDLAGLIEWFWFKL